MSRALLFHALFQAYVFPVINSRKIYEFAEANLLCYSLQGTHFEKPNGDNDRPKGYFPAKYAAVPEPGAGVSRENNAAEKHWGRNGIG